MRTVVVVILVLLAGFLAGKPTPVPMVYAACGVQPNCGPDQTQTSVLAVTHTSPAGGNDIPVEPNTGETWNITAYWSTTIGAPRDCDCLTPYSASVSATVTWQDQGGWSVSCTGCSPSGPIRSVSVCHVDGCGTQYVDNGWTYKLLVDVDHTGPTYWCPVSQTWASTYLTSVNYTTTAVSGGNLVDVVRCSEGSSVTPDSQSWSATDTGAFECALSCDYDGASVAITYQ